jgi:cation diffusion facilitator family transporter
VDAHAASANPVGLETSSTKARDKSAKRAESFGDLTMHSHHHSHAHSHGLGASAGMLTSRRGIWAIKWSSVLLTITAVLQLGVVFYSGSVALLADTIHNFTDAATAIPLWIAFRLSEWKPTKRFTYGYGRVEDLAGVGVVLMILLSAIAAGWESINRLLHPQPMQGLGAVAIAAVLGFIGNEIVAQLRIKVGEEIQSAALIADGRHARIDGLTSLSVLVGAAGVWLGWPIVDPIVGMLITLTILGIVWDSMKTVFTRMLDGVEPRIVDEIRATTQRATGVHDVTEVRARWIGHRLHVEINLAMRPDLTVKESHHIASHVQHELMHELPYVSNVVIHVDPDTESGEVFHEHLADAVKWQTQRT